jgi:hypothetical protein
MTKTGTENDAFHNSPTVHVFVEEGKCLPIHCLCLLRLWLALKPQHPETQEMDDQITEPLPSIGHLHVASLTALSDFQALRNTSHKYLHGIVMAIPSGFTIPLLSGKGENWVQKVEPRLVFCNELAFPFTRSTDEAVTG